MEDDRNSTGWPELHGQDIAVQHGERRLGFAELHACSSRLATRLLELGLQPGNAVIVQTPLCIELVVIECALEKAALIKIGAAPFASVETIKGEASRHVARAIVVHAASCRSEEMASMLDVFDLLICIGKPMQGFLRYEDLVHQAVSSDAQPSGKDVMTSSPGVDRQGGRARSPGIGKAGRVAVVGPLSHDAAMVTLPQLHAGNSLVLFDRMQDAGLLPAAAEEGVTHVLMELRVFREWVNGSNARMPQESRFMAGNRPQPAGGDSEDLACAALESALGSHPAVMEVCVVKTVSHDLHAVVALHPGSHAIAAELIAYCGFCNAGHDRLRGVTFVAELPKNASGNLARKLIREQYRQAYRMPG